MTGLTFQKMGFHHLIDKWEIRATVKETLVALPQNGWVGRDLKDHSVPRPHHGLGAPTSSGYPIHGLGQL